ncbi:DUF927 domain-containing protein [Solidesulfovibrio alcoholivorans]|uniref:DUF927 domain-containing protein n=1 Tax=Solidesulfovibrio alcoholivorans TaxID=81406 RepID=UPI000A015742|nr:DUF927 domain-containing protein [Solidesulfovibrio alcoholivorans]
MLKNFIKQSLTENVPSPTPEAPAPILIKQRIADAPVAMDAVLPGRYLLTKELSIDKQSESGGQIISRFPLFISELSQNRSTGLHYVTLSWKADGRWHNWRVERCMIATKSNIVALSNYNIPVTSLNANSLIKYLQEYEEVNTRNIPRTFAEGRLGWTDDMSGFLWGHSYLTGPSVQQSSGQPPVVRFKGADLGDEQFADGFKQNGDFPTWILLANELLEYPDVAFSMYTSLAAPLLPILGVDNFTLELCAPSSSGKTSTLKFAASVWGNPSFASGSFINTWNGTDNRIGRIAGLLNGLPLFLDETKFAEKYKNKNRYGSDLVTDTIYMIASGLDKGRATIHGSDRLQPFRTILFSTGETPSLDLSNDGGSRGRIIDLCGIPFLKQDSESNEVVNKIKHTIDDHYGHAGPCLVQFILNHRDQWPLWKSAYKETRQMLTQFQNMSPIEMRLTEYFAAVAIAIPIVHAAIPGLRRDKPVVELFRQVWERAKYEASSADIGLKAIQCVDDWIKINPDKIYSPDHVRKNILWSGDRFGAYWDNQGDDNWTFIGLTKPCLDDLLRKNHLKTNEIVRLWKNKGWLWTDGSSKGYQRQVAIPGAVNGTSTMKLNLYCISKQNLVSAVKN